MYSYYMYVVYSKKIWGKILKVVSHLNMQITYNYYKEYSYISTVMRFEKTQLPRTTTYMYIYLNHWSSQYHKHLQYVGVEGGSVGEPWIGKQSSVKSDNCQMASSSVNFNSIYVAITQSC